MRWLGFDWGEHLYHASDYFEQLYDWARPPDPRRQGLRRRPVGRRDPRAPRHADRAGPQLARGATARSTRTSTCSRGCAPASSPTARACCARRSTWRRPNINLRDPVLYRIVHAAHPRTGDAWCIYPTYDFAHGQSDAIEGVTHSLCTLEFEAHRPLYDWLIEHLPVPSRPRQYRVRPAQPHLHGALQALPAAAGRRGPRPRLGRPAHADDLRPAPARLPGRGHPRLRRRWSASPRPTASIEFGPARARRARRAQPDGAAALRRPRPAQGRHRELPRGPDRGDGGPEQPRGPGRRDAAGAVRARAVDRARRLHGGARRRSSSGSRRAARCACGRRTSSPASEVVKDAAGRVVELRCTYDPATRGGDAPDGRRPKATLHWVSAAHAVPAEVRLYDHLFTRPDPGASDDLFADLNPDSETVVTGAFVEPSLAGAEPGETVQFERLGYFAADPDSRARAPRLQPDADAQGHLGEGPGPNLSESAEGPTCSPITGRCAARLGGSRSSMASHGTRRSADRSAPGVPAPARRSRCG